LADLIKNSAYRGQAAYGKRRQGERRRLRPGRGHPTVPKKAAAWHRQPASAHILIPVPALVDPEVFAAAQQTVAHNRAALRQRHSGARHFLQGLAVCACCGYALCGHGRPPRYYYRCLGRDGFRFAGRRLCRNRPQRTEDLDAAVWQDVYQLLREPERLRQEFERRQRGAAADQPAEGARAGRAIAQAKQALGRLIDAYSAGLLQAQEFEPRIQRLRERLAKLEAEAQQQAQALQEQHDVGLVLGRFEVFTDQINQHVSHADGGQRREILRALVKRVEVDQQIVRIVYEVPPRPFAKGPQGGPSQHCQGLQ
jgi:site-specific DNA recombinase